MIKYILFFALCTGGCMKGSNTEEGKESSRQTERLDTDTIGTGRVDSAFLNVFFERFQQLQPFRERVQRFYDKRDQRLAWTKGGVPIPHAKLLVNVIKNIPDHGLPNPDNISYHIRDTLSAILDSEAENDSSAKTLRKSFDLALTSLYFQNAPKLWQGTVNPHREDGIEWFVEPKKIAYRQMLDSMLADTESKNPFIDYRQFNPQYLKLKEKLKWFSDPERNRESAPLKFTGASLSKGDSATIVEEISQRLLYLGDLEEQVKGYVFCSKLEEAVKNFQARHGLKPDGVVGQQTLGALNVSIENRMRQIMINMERWRWVPPGMKGDYVYVNIPQFELSIFQNNKKVDRMKVIVGKGGAETVVFSDKIKYIVINPYWNIPKSIAIDEILPRIKNEKGYPAEANINVGINWDFDVVDQDTIDWGKISESNFNYTLRKEPGLGNPLGQIKFIFPNDFAIYLHDTPATKLFDERERGFSHGCIRVEKPLRLADRLLGRKDAVDIDQLLDEKQDHWITLSQRIPIYILYFTTWVDEDSEIHFREDIYGHDSDLASILFNESM